MITATPCCRRPCNSPSLLARSASSAACCSVASLGLGRALGQRDFVRRPCCGCGNDAGSANGSYCDDRRELGRLPAGRPCRFSCAASASSFAQASAAGADRRLLLRTHGRPSRQRTCGRRRFVRRPDRTGCRALRRARRPARAISASLPGVTPAFFVQLSFVSHGVTSPALRLVDFAFEAEVDDDRGLHRIVVGVRVDADRQVFHLGEPLDLREPIEESSRCSGSFLCRRA